MVKRIFANINQKSVTAECPTFAPSMLNRILIIQTAFIGDVVLATSLLEQLHQTFPQAQFDMMVRKGNEGLLMEHPFLGQLYVWDKKKKYRDLWRILRLIRKKRYDLVVNVQRFAATGLITAFSGAKHTIGFDKNPLSSLFTRRIPHRISSKNQPLHEVDRNQQLIALLTTNAPVRPVLYPSDQVREKIRSFQDKPYICIAPASVWFTKQYPEDRWAEVIDALPNNLTVYIIGGPGDASLAERIIGQTKARSGLINLCGKLSLLESAALQKDAIRNLVNDSAPLHFASAMNAPVTAIYCSTIPEFGYGPLSEDSKIIQSSEPLECRPCGLHGHKQCPKGHFRCAYSIPVQQIVDTIKFP